MRSQPSYFPIHALPPVIRDAVFEVQGNVKAPIAMIASSAFSAMSLAIQGIVDIRLPIGQVRPVSLFLITVADSGERKTGVDQLFMKPIVDFEKQANEIFEADLVQHESELEMWELKKKSLTAQILKLEAKGENDVG